MEISVSLYVCTSLLDSPYTGFSNHWKNVKLVEVPGNMGVHVSVSFSLCFHEQAGFSNTSTNIKPKCKLTWTSATECSSKFGITWDMFQWKQAKNLCKVSIVSKEGRGKNGYD